MLPAVKKQDQFTNSRNQRHNNKMTIKLTAKIPIGRISNDQDYQNTQKETERLNQKPQNPIRITRKQLDKRLSNSLENNGNA